MKYRITDFFGATSALPVVPIDIKPLPLFPVRYSVVPDEVTLPLPAALSNNKTQQVALNHHRYVLRTTRTGYVYVLYEKPYRPNRGREQYSAEYWQAYQTNGITYTPIAPGYRKLSYKGGLHPASVAIFVSRPWEHETLWLAFSEHCWSRETLDSLQHDPALRQRRMQAFSPAQWVQSQTCPHQHSLPLSPQTLDEHVLEYHDNYDYFGALGDEEPISQTDSQGTIDPSGQHNTEQLRQNFTHHPVHMQVGESQKLADYLGYRPGKTQHQPAMIALTDSLGIATELNGYRNDTAGHIARYGEEHALRIDALNSIETIKTLFENRAATFLTEHYRIITQPRSVDPTVPVAYRHREWLAGLWRPEQCRIIPLTKEEDIKRYGSGMVEVIPPDYHARKQRAQAKAKMAATRQWQQYQAKLDSTRIATFNTHYHALLHEAETLTHARTDDLLAWLESPLLLDALTEYHPENHADGEAFASAVGDIMQGIGTSPHGAQKIEQWATQGSIGEANLLWRGLLLNQTAALAEGEAISALAAGSLIPLNQSTLDNIGGTTKLNKIADLYKKSVSFYNANNKSGVAKVKTYGFEKLFLSAGNALLKPFTKTLDSINQSLIQSVLLLRAGAPMHQVTALATANMMTSGNSLWFEHLKSRFSTHTHYGPILDDVNQKWQGFKKADLTPQASKKFSGVTEMRIAGVVALLEMYNLYKLMHYATPNEPALRVKLNLQMTYASLATVAVTSDIFANAIKIVASDQSHLYQKIKLMGGALSMSASFIGAYLDFVDSEYLDKKGEAVLANIYFTRGLTQTVSGISTIMGSLSYSQQVLATSRYYRTASLAGFAFKMRATFMFVGLSFSIITLALTFTIWYFSDDELEDWCDACAFAKTPKKSYWTVQQQQEALSIALYRIELINEKGNPMLLH